MKHILFFLLICMVQNLSASTPATSSGRYLGFKEISDLGKDLVESLPAAQRAVMNSRPVFFETEVRPSIRLVEYPGNPITLRSVFISAGFVDLMNYLAHARAIDKFEKGFLKRYLATLSQERGDVALKSPVDPANPKYWTEEILNEQKSNFNQMVGGILAIELSHHYSGTFKRMASELPDNSDAQAINTLLSLDDWEKAVRFGVRNALDVGLGVEGLIALYESFDQMPARPNWAVFFFHRNAHAGKLRKDLTSLEKRFFSGKNE